MIQLDLVAYIGNSEFSIFVQMRDLISGRAFTAKNMDEAFVRFQILRGGSALVEHTMRASGTH